MSNFPWQLVWPAEALCVLTGHDSTELVLTPGGVCYDRRRLAGAALFLVEGVTLPDRRGPALRPQRRSVTFDASQGQETAQAGGSRLVKRDPAARAPAAGRGAGDRKRGSSYRRSGVWGDP